MITLGRDEFPDDVLDMTITELSHAKRAASSPRADRNGKQLIADGFAALTAEKKRRRQGGGRS